MSQLWLLTRCQHLSENKLYKEFNHKYKKKKKKEREMRNICWSKRLTSFCISLSSMNENVILMFTKLYLYYSNFSFKYTFKFSPSSLQIYIFVLLLCLKNPVDWHMLCWQNCSHGWSSVSIVIWSIYCFIAITFVTRWSSINVTVT